MGRSHKPRKRYIPKRMDADPVGLAMAFAAKLTAAQRAELVGPIGEAFEAFRTGRVTPQHWCDLADSMNVAEVLAEIGIASDHADTFAAAQRVLGNVAERAKAGRGHTLYAAELTALDDAVFIHKVQLEHCSQAELQRAIDTVRRRVSGALAGNASPTTRVVTGLLGRTAEAGA